MKPEMTMSGLGKFFPKFSSILLRSPWTNVAFFYSIYLGIKMSICDGLRNYFIAINMSITVQNWKTRN